jgi:hypothetical protein
VRKLKKIIAFLLIAVSLCLSACSTRSVNPDIAALPDFQSTTMDRLVITNSRYAGKYTIATSNTIKSIKKYILKAKGNVEDSLLEPDFVFEFYSGSKKVATFYYTAKINDDGTSNLKDENGNLYHISTNVEQSFMKRIMRSDDRENVSSYYTSLVTKLLDKTEASSGNVVVIDISDDDSITKSMTSIEQKHLLDSISSKGVSLKFPSEVEQWNYYITINTTQYTDDSCKGTVTINDVANNTSVKYSVQGDYETEWEYHIQYK